MLRITVEPLKCMASRVYPCSLIKELAIVFGFVKCKNEAAYLNEREMNGSFWVDAFKVSKEGL